MNKEKRGTTFLWSVPACTDTGTYESWKGLARKTNMVPRIGFCEDCTPEYQAEMISVRRCENPEIRFFYEPIHFEFVEKQNSHVRTGGDIYGNFAPRSYLDSKTKIRTKDIEVFASDKIKLKSA